MSDDSYMQGAFILLDIERKFDWFAEEHPERAAYLLGAEDHGLSPAVLAMCHRIVVLPGRHCLNVAVAGSLILYDRWLRGALSDRATSSLRGVLVPR